jgi:hypothetical protein
MIEGGGGGHASERENIAPQRKEPENAPDATPIMSKGVLMQYKNVLPINTPGKNRYKR